MLKKVITIAAMLVLVTLLAAPLVLAQQDASQEDQPAEGEAAQTPPASLGDPLRLDENGNLVVDCAVAFQNLAQLEPFAETLANDPEFQAELAEARDLAQLCADSGYSPLDGVGPGGSPPANTGFEQYQGGQTTTPEVPADGTTPATQPSDA